MSQEIEKNEPKELSLSEANDELNKALQLIKKNTIKPPNETYKLLSVKERKILVILSIAGIISSLITGATLAFSTGSMFALICPALVSPCFMLASLEDWNGNPKHRFRTLMVKLFGTKKIKRELANRQEEYRKYYQSMEVFKLYVADMRHSLTKQGVFDVINQNDEEKHHYLSDDGVYYFSENKLDISRLNDTRVDDMLKSLAKSPHIKEQLMIGLDK